MAKPTPRKSSKTSSSPQWKSRIVGHASVNPTELVPNKKNWRLHPHTQQQAMDKVLENVGWVTSVIVNKRTGNIVDGHLRVERAIANKESEVPVVYVDLTQTEEDTILATFDPISGLARADSGKLVSLLAGIKKLDAGAGEIVQEIQKDALFFDPGQAISRDAYEYGGVIDFDDSVWFPTKNKFGIPDLRVDMLYGKVPVAVWPDTSVADRTKLDWAFNFGQSGAFHEAADKIVMFNLFDEDFEHVFYEASDFLKKALAVKVRALVEPDYSMWVGEPKVLQLYSLYRRRWCGRFWQEAGVKVLPQLNWSTEESYDFAFTGLPEKFDAAMCQARTLGDEVSKKSFLKGLHAACERLKIKTIAIYGGLEHAKWLDPNLPKGPEFVLLESWQSLRRKYRLKSGVTQPKQRGASNV